MTAPSARGATGPRRITVFGATGETGRLLVRRALADGHAVVAYARNPAKLDVRDERRHDRGRGLDDTAGDRDGGVGGAARRRELGQALFGALLPDRVGRLYDLSRQVADDRGRGLRLRLRVLDPGLATLPWELLYDPGRDEYLCRSARDAVVRHVESAQPLRETLRVPPPLRVLGVVATPDDQESLGAAEERGWIDQAVRLGLRELGRGQRQRVEGGLLQRAQRPLQPPLGPGDLRAADGPEPALEFRPLRPAQFVDGRPRPPAALLQHQQRPLPAALLLPRHGDRELGVVLALVPHPLSLPGRRVCHPAGAPRAVARYGAGPGSGGGRLRG